MTLIGVVCACCLLQHRSMCNCSRRTRGALQLRDYGDGPDHVQQDRVFATDAGAAIDAVPAVSDGLCHQDRHIL